MSKFTKGQWMLDDSPDEYNGNIFTYDPDGSYIGIARIKGLDYIDFKTEAQANARLIVAAPKMYEAIRNLVSNDSPIDTAEQLLDAFLELKILLACIDGEAEE